MSNIRTIYRINLDLNVKKKKEGTRIYDKMEKAF